MLRLGSALCRSQIIPNSALLRGASARFCSSDGSKLRQSKKSDEDVLFAADNLEGISKLEQARMKVMFGLVKEHVKAVDEGLPPPDPTQNPMIDPRSFDVEKLPDIPSAVLKAFRNELPAKLAGSVRPVPTQTLWEPAEGDNPVDLAARHSAEWAAVDKRTMEHRQFSKMQRQAMHGLGAEVSPPTASVMRPKRRCVLSDEKGRVNIDYRSFGKISTFVSEGGKLYHRRRTGLSAKAQRKVSRAVKSARHMALLAPEPRNGPTMDELRELYKAML